MKYIWIVEIDRRDGKGFVPTIKCGGNTQSRTSSTIGVLVSNTGA